MSNSLDKPGVASSGRRPASPRDELLAEVEDFCGWWHLHREGSVNATYDYIDKLTRRLRAALSVIESQQEKPKPMNEPSHCLHCGHAAWHHKASGCTVDSVARGNPCGCVRYMAPADWNGPAAARSVVEPREEQRR